MDPRAAREALQLKAAAQAAEGGEAAGAVGAGRPAALEVLASACTGSTPRTQPSNYSDLLSELSLESGARTTPSSMPSIKSSGDLGELAPDSATGERYALRGGGGGGRGRGSGGFMPQDGLGSCGGAPPSIMAPTRSPPEQLADDLATLQVENLAATERVQL